MKGKMIMLVTTVIMVGVTILIYNMAVAEWTPSLKLAVGVICLSEVAVMCTLGLLPEVNLKNGSTGIMVQTYAALMIIWSLIGPGFEKESVFHIGLLVISLVMLAVIGLTIFGSHETEELNKETESIINRKRETCYTSQATPVRNGESLSAMRLTTQSIEDPVLRKQARVLMERIQAMPASRFPDARIEHGVREIAAMSRALSNPEAKERVQARMQSKIRELSNYIKTL